MEQMFSIKVLIGKALDLKHLQVNILLLNISKAFDCIDGKTF